MMLILLAAGCSTHINALNQSGSKPPSEIEFAVAEPVFWGDYVEGDPFRVNSTIGNVTFTGGYITTDDGLGLHNVSKNVAITEQERYRKQVEQWLGDALHPTVVVSSLTPPTTREVRGSTSADGHDNVSLPRMSFQPVATNALPQATLVPWVISYYSHNGGWFHGQQWGTGAGARVHVLLVAYNKEGNVLGWQNVDASRISELLFSPTGPQLQDFLIHLEKKIGQKI